MVFFFNRLRNRSKAPGKLLLSDEPGVSDEAISRVFADENLSVKTVNLAKRPEVIFERALRAPDLAELSLRPICWA